MAATYAEARERGGLSSRVWVLDQLGRAVRGYALDTQFAQLWLPTDILDAVEQGIAPRPIQEAWVAAVADGANWDQLVDAVRYAWRTPTGPGAVRR